MLASTPTGLCQAKSPTEESHSEMSKSHRQSTVSQFRCDILIIRCPSLFHLQFVPTLSLDGASATQAVEISGLNSSTIS